MGKKIDIEKVGTFYKSIEKDDNHRYKSWEHCFNYFLKPINEIKLDTDKASLHLAFYLASWGMYRGSGYLLQKDYLIHQLLIEDIILNKEYEPLKSWDLNGNENESNIKLLFELNSAIKEYYKKNITSINSIKKTINVSDVLSTKIILGTFGCVPAYDRYFISGLRVFDEKFGFTFNKKSFNNLVNVYKSNKDEIDKLSKEIFFYKHKYPIMKIIDMYFWQVGFEEDQKKQHNKKILQLKNRK